MAFCFKFKDTCNPSFFPEKSYVISVGDSPSTVLLQFRQYLFLSESEPISTSCVGSVRQWQTDMGLW